MVYQKILEDLKQAVKELGFETSDIVLSICENPKFGDYTSNIPLQLSKQKSKKHYHSPREIANDILEKLGHPNYLQEINTAGPGFLNFTVKDEELVKSLQSSDFSLQTTNLKKVLVEYASPNANKEFHIGHLRNVILGESIARLIESQGVLVYRANYTADIGLPLAKTLWAVMEMEAEYRAVKKKTLQEKVAFLGRAYVKGTESYEKDPEKKSEIDSINKSIYGREPQFLELWYETRDWSLNQFDELYARLGTHFDGLFLESEVESIGKTVVNEHINKVFIEDQGAVIFPGEKFGLHNRVFITSAGNPTYEAKEVGVTKLEQEAAGADLYLHIVGNEQAGYFQVVIKAIEMLDPKSKGRKKHISYGLVTLASGKMSSRLGNIVTAESLIDQIKGRLRKVMKGQDLNNGEEVLEHVTVGAVKFWMLKYAPMSGIVFDIDKSVSLQGDSGPYVQYTYARTKSILRKNAKESGRRKSEESKESDESRESEAEIKDLVEGGLEGAERDIARFLEYFGLVVSQSSVEYRPNLICEYLLDLSKLFNLFYQQYPIIKSERSTLRLLLTGSVAQVLYKGLYLLGIKAPERM